MKISACLIVKDEEKNIATCLQSIKDIVDEIIVVDTGSTDRTIEIAKTYKARIFEIKWMNDFSKARNYALARAKGNWIICLDADEYFTNESIAQIPYILKTAEEQQLEAINCLFNHVNVTDKRVIMSSSGIRIIKNDSSIRYKGKIHEAPFHAHHQLRVGDATNVITIIHTGYTPNVIDEKKKGDRNLGLLLEELERNPCSSDLCFYISEAYQLNFEFEKALDYAYKVTEYNNSIMQGVYQKNYCNIITIMNECNYPWTQIEEVILTATRKFPSFPDFQIYTGDVHRKAHRIHDAIEAYKRGINQLERMKDSQSRTYLYLDQIFYYLGDLNYQLGDLKSAVENYINSLKSNKYYILSTSKLASVLTKHETSADIISLFSRLYNLNEIKDVVYLYKIFLLIYNKDIANHLNQLLEDFQYEKVDLKEEEAGILLLNEVFSDSLKLYTELYRVSPNNEIAKKIIVCVVLSGEPKLLELCLDLLPSEYIRTGSFFLKCNKSNFSDAERNILIEIIRELIHYSRADVIDSCINELYSLGLTIELAEILHKSENYSSALELYDLYLSSNDIPLHSKSLIFYLMGDCLKNCNKFQLADHYLSEAQKMMSDPSYEIYELRLSVLKKSNDEEKYIHVIMDAANKFPDSEYFSTEAKNCASNIREKPNSQLTLNFQGKGSIEDGPLVSVVVLAYNKLEYTKLCVESILRYTSHINYELILVNNGSSDGTKNYFESINGSIVVNLEQNVGPVNGFNAGMKIARGKYTACVCNDFIFTPRWMDNLLACMESDEKIGFCSPGANFISNNQRIDGQYSNIDEMLNFAQEYNKSNPSLWEERVRLLPCVLMVRTHLLQEIGYFDPIFYFGEFADDDISFRIRRAGYKLVFAGDTFTYHFGSITTGVDQKENDSLAVSRKIFIEKHGIDSWTDANFNQNQIDFIEFPQWVDESRLDDEFRILGINTKCGATPLQLKNKLQRQGIKHIRLYNFCEEKKFLLDLQSISELAVCGPLSKLSSYLGGQLFHCILLDGELESYHNLDELVDQIKILLHPKGQLILTTNNPSYYEKLFRMVVGEKTVNKTKTILITPENLENFLMKKGMKISSQLGLQNPTPESHESIVTNLAAIFGQPDSKTKLTTHSYMYRITF